MNVADHEKSHSKVAGALSAADSFVLTNARIVTEHEVFDGSMVVREGQIAEVLVAVPV